MNIILTTLNARYAHSSIGLRYIYANLNEFQKSTTLLEFNINDALQTVAEKILHHNPNIIGIGVYIWNAKEVQELLHIIKKISPNTLIVLGGPEVSYQPLRINFDQADFIVQGEGEISFYELCKSIYNNQTPKERVFPLSTPKLKEIQLPYEFYTDEDIQNRYIYVEISRGCPFECEFCLSSIDEKVRSFKLEKILEEFQVLWQRGARNFKFVDRTFNINIKSANKILDFFLEKKEQYFVHFEVIPDHFPSSIKEKIKLFPNGALQFEIGIQTLNPTVAKNISREMNLEKMEENLHFLENDTSAHLHLDLIVGLPGESLQSFGKNLDTLVAMSSCEIQIGILKKLSGTAIDRHDEKYKMIYSEIPPYDILQNDLLSFQDIQDMKRFARFWDLTYNSGNFKKTIPFLWENGSVFENFYKFSLWIYKQTDATWKISLQRLAELLFNYLICEKKISTQTIAQHILQDIGKIKGRAIPSYLKPYLSTHTLDAKEGKGNFNKRQK